MNSVDQVVTRMRALRFEKGYTQRYVAHKLRISQNAYSKMEIGKSQLTMERLILFADVMDVDLVNLLITVHYKTIL